ncbi:MAG: hypothetical protein WA160_01220 [Pseudobdellovibrio sp.]
MLTAITVYSYVDQGDDEKKELASILLVPTNKPEQNFRDRKPASISEKQLLEKRNQIKVFCDPSNLKLKSDKTLLMLEVSSCPILKEKHPLWVKNVSNGFKAQIFKVSDQNYRTDFIQLNPGVNEIKIEGILKDGQNIVQTLEIVSGS